MGKRLYVGNLSYTVTDEQLTERFTQFGTVESVKVIMDKITGRSKGFGFVEMAADDDAQKAIEALNGATLDGRAIVVNEARPQEPRSEGPRGGGGGGGRRRY